MVKDHQQGNITNSQYIQQYRLILDKVRDSLVQACKGHTHINFQCYCKDNTFCHTYILIQYLIYYFPNFFYDSFDYFERWEWRKN